MCINKKHFKFYVFSFIDFKPLGHRTNWVSISVAELFINSLGTKTPSLLIKWFRVGMVTASASAIVFKGSKSFFNWLHTHGARHKGWLTTTRAGMIWSEFAQSQTDMPGWWHPGTRTPIQIRQVTDQKRRVSQRLKRQRKRRIRSWLARTTNGAPRAASMTYWRALAQPRPGGSPWASNKSKQRVCPKILFP